MEAFWQQKPGELKVVGGEAPLWRAGLLCRHCSRDCFSPALSGCQKLLCQEPALSGPYPSCSHFRHRFGRLGMERWPGFSGTVWLLSPLFYQGGQIFLFSAPINHLGEPSRDGWGGWFSSTPGGFAFGCFLPGDPISRSDFPVLAMAPRGSKRLDLFIFQLAADPRGPVTHPHPFPSARSRVWLVTVIVPKRVALLCIYIDPNRGHLELWLRYFFFGGGRFYLEEAPEPASARERVRTVERAGFLAAARGDP